MSKAAELAKWGEVSTNGQVSGRRNIIINGAMQVAQRGTSATGVGAAEGYLTLDRWKFATDATAGRLTMTQTADGPVGFANCIKLDCTTADTSITSGEFMKLEQRFEGQDLQAIGKGVAGAKEITVSFYVKANAAFTFAVELFDVDNQRQITKLFDTTTGWVRHEITFPADVDDGSSPFVDDNAQSMQIGFYLHAGATYTGGTLNTAAWANLTQANRAAGIDSFYSSTDNNFFITGVQMEVGSVATPFEHRSFGEELALCQRYYEKSYNAAVVPGTSTTVGCDHFMAPRAVTIESPDFTTGSNFKVSHRSTPTVTVYSTGGASGKVFDASGNADVTVTTGNEGDNSYSLNFAIIDTRLYQWQWTASSEL